MAFFLDPDFAIIFKVCSFQCLQLSWLCVMDDWGGVWQRVDRELDSAGGRSMGWVLRSFGRLYCGDSLFCRVHPPWRDPCAYLCITQNILNVFGHCYLLKCFQRVKAVVSWWSCLPWERLVGMGCTRTSSENADWIDLIGFTWLFICLPGLIDFWKCVLSK